MIAVGSWLWPVRLVCWLGVLVMFVFVGLDGLGLRYVLFVLWILVSLTGCGLVGLGFVVCLPLGLCGCFVLVAGCCFGLV